MRRQRVAGERQARRRAGRHDRLWDFRHVAPNPGRLRARVYVPGTLAEGAPLVVVLHGCLQSAAEYDDGAGWSRLADLHGFALLFPQQRRKNNPLRGFNWFRRGDSRRNGGEPLSIVKMVEEVARHYRTDPKRVFVTGLSAGGAMTSVLLATYPDVFAGGAIIAGLPYAAASTVRQAVRRMKGEDGAPPAQRLASDVRGASGRVGPWPIVSVWHGGKDETVHALNTLLIIDQWVELHGLAGQSTGTEDHDGHTRRVWRDPSGREVIEEYLIPDMGHGTPIAGSGEDRGNPRPYMLTVDLSSTHRIAGFWGVIPRDCAPGAA